MFVHGTDTDSRTTGTKILASFYDLNDGLSQEGSNRDVAAARQEKGLFTTNNSHCARLLRPLPPNDVFGFFNF
jgi:hypothetical protein